MTTPTTNGKVPASTPARDQPMPLSILEMKTAAPKVPVRRAVAVSRLRREIMTAFLIGEQPAFFGGDVMGTRHVLGDEFAERVAGEEGVGLRGPLDIFLPFRRGLNF